MWRDVLVDLVMVISQRFFSFKTNMNFFPTRSRLVSENNLAMDLLTYLNTYVVGRIQEKYFIVSPQPLSL